MKRLLLALAVVVTTTGVAGAQPDEAAKEKAASAKAAFDRGDYAVAVEQYREAYRLVPSPGLLFNLAQAYRLLGSCAEAAEAYREYLRLVPDSPYLETAQQNLAAADVCARDAAAAAKRREERKRAAELAATTAATPPPPPPRDEGAGMRRAGVGAMAAGGMLVIAGGYFAFDAARQQEKVSDFYASGGAWDDVADADERGRRAQLISRVSFGVGAVALATGATLYVLGRRNGAVAVSPQRGGAEMVVSWRF